MATDPKISSIAEPTIRPLRENDLQTADRIFRLAFGTFLGYLIPYSFTPVPDYVRTRWLADPEAAFGAELENVPPPCSSVIRAGEVCAPQSLRAFVPSYRIKETLNPVVNKMSFFFFPTGGLVT